MILIESSLQFMVISQTRQLERQQIVSTPIGQDLYWDYYCFVKEPPIIKWSVPTYILKGDNDDLSESNVVFQFAERFSCKLNITIEAGHYLHNPTELDSINNWLEKII